MIDTDKYEGHTEAPWDWFPTPNDSHIGHLQRHSNLTRVTAEIKSRSAEDDANAQLIADAPLLLGFIQKIVKDWCKPNQCNQAFGKDVRQLMYEYGLITFNEETRRYEVKE